MSQIKEIEKKIFSINRLANQVTSWKKGNQKIVFTNGCFDIIHRGHIEVLARTADLGDKLIVGLNSDSSIRKIKGQSRPIIDERSRALLLASFRFIDAVILFSEETPENLIRSLKPEVLAKGGDYKINEIVGNKIIKENGGRIVLIPFIDGFSSTKVINKIKNE